MFEVMNIWHIWILVATAALFGVNTIDNWVWRIFISIYPVIVSFSVLLLVANDKWVTVLVKQLSLITWLHLHVFNA